MFTRLLPEKFRYVLHCCVVSSFSSLPFNFIFIEIAQAYVAPFNVEWLCYICVPNDTHNSEHKQKSFQAFSVLDPLPLFVVNCL